MSRPLGKRVVVIGAGMGGLTAAGALAAHFERVVVLERDTLPSDPGDRAAIPQGRHVHVLTAEVQNLLKPRSAYRDPELVQRIEALRAGG